MSRTTPDLVRQALLRELRERFLQLHPAAIVSRLAIWRLLGGDDDALVEQLRRRK
jgi:hypothetical protein